MSIITTEQIVRTAADPLCYPPLDRSKDLYQNNYSFAQALRSHIEYCTAPAQREEAEDPKQVLIY